MTDFSASLVRNNSGETPTPTVTYTSHDPWNAGRPDTLVIACSDGRIQTNVDDFLLNHLGVRSYDRIYLPGGPGGLVVADFEFMRADQFRRECSFLVAAHGTERVVLLFHGAAPDGPPLSVCADYRRKMPGHTVEEIDAQQRADVKELLRLFSWHANLKVLAYRAEVCSDGNVRFVDLMPE